MTLREIVKEVLCWVAIVVVVGFLIYAFQRAAHAGELTALEMQTALDTFRNVALPIANHRVSIKSFRVRHGRAKHVFEVTVTVKEQ